MPTRHHHQNTSRIVDANACCCCHVVSVRNFHQNFLKTNIFTFSLCCCVPYCCSCCKNVHHYCSNCGQYIETFRRWAKPHFVVLIAPLARLTRRSVTGTERSVDINQRKHDKVWCREDLLWVQESIKSLFTKRKSDYDVNFCQSYRAGKVSNDCTLLSRPLKNYDFFLNT